MQKPFKTRNLLEAIKDNIATCARVNGEQDSKSQPHDNDTASKHQTTFVREESEGDDLIKSANARTEGKLEPGQGGSETVLEKKTFVEEEDRSMISSNRREALVNERTF